MKNLNDKFYYLEYFSVIFLILSFIVLVTAILNHRKNKTIKNIEYQATTNDFDNTKEYSNNDINNQKYKEHITVLKKIGFNILNLNLSSTVASIYVDKNYDSYKKLKELYPKCVVIEFENKYQIFIDHLFEQKNIQNHAIANMQGKYEVQYIILYTDGSWKVKINNIIYENNSNFSHGFHIIKVSDSQVTIETDDSQIYQISL